MMNERREPLCLTDRQLALLRKAAATLPLEKRVGGGSALNHMDASVSSAFFAFDIDLLR
jgi:hypothetical protein